jgi:hypothetical protein
MCTYSLMPSSMGACVTHAICPSLHCHPHAADGDRHPRVQLFRGLRLYFNGRTGADSAHHLKKVVEQHGGAPDVRCSAKVAYIIGRDWTRVLPCV